MKQLTILCSSDLADRVRDILIDAGVDGFMELPHAVGTKPGAAAEHGRFPRFDAEMIIAPAENDKAERVVDELARYIGSCEVEPCLRVLVAPLDAVY